MHVRAAEALFDVVMHKVYSWDYRKIYKRFVTLLMLHVSNDSEFKGQEIYILRKSSVKLASKVLCMIYQFISSLLGSALPCQNDHQLPQQAAAR